MRSTPPWTADLSSVAHTAAALAAAYRVGLASALAAWPVLLGRAVFYGVCLTILGAFWGKVAAEHLPGTLAARLPAGGLGRYVGVTELITLSVTTIQLRLEDELRSGALEPHLLRPKHYLAQTLAGEAGGMSARFAVLGAAGLALLAATGGPWPSASALAGVVVLAVLGAFVGVLLFTLVGLTAFWLRRVLPALLITQKLIFLLGGLFAPIALYPPWLHAIAAATPFAAHIAFAGEAMLAPSWTQFARALAAQLAWIAVLGALAALMWRAGLAKTLREGV